MRCVVPTRNEETGNEAAWIVAPSSDPAAFAKKVHLLWLGVGTQEPERMLAGIRRLHASLTEAVLAAPEAQSPVAATG